MIQSQIVLHRFEAVVPCGLGSAQIRPSGGTVSPPRVPVRTSDATIISRAVHNSTTVLRYCRRTGWAVILSITVSAGAKIPIVPVEFSPPPDVVHRSLLRMEEVPRLVKGERRARTKRTATARDEHPGDQQADRLGSQDDSKVYASGGGGAGVRAAFTAAK